MRLLSLVVTLAAWAIPATARSDDRIGLAVGPRGGVELHDDADLVLGADLRLSFPLSPLTINPIFDYYLDEDKTQFQIGINALYHLPVPNRRLTPYAGIGVAVIAFSFHEGVITDDDNGSRVCMNLLAGVRLDLPVVRPFAQVMVTVGEIDLITVGGGLLFDLLGGGGGRRRK